MRRECMLLAALLLLLPSGCRKPGPAAPETDRTPRASEGPAAPVTVVNTWARLVTWGALVFIHAKLSRPAKAE